MRISDWSSDACSSDLVDADAAVVDIGEAGVDHFAQVVRRDVGRHADRDAARAVDEQVGERRRQHLRLALAGVVIGLEIDRILVEIGQQRVRDLGKARFGVAHRQGRERRSEEHTSELQSLMRISYAVFCLKKKKNNKSLQNLETN